MMIELQSGMNGFGEVEVKGEKKFENLQKIDSISWQYTQLTLIVMQLMKTAR